MKILFAGDTVLNSPFTLGETIKHLCAQHNIRVFNLEGAFSEEQNPIIKAGTHILSNIDIFSSIEKYFNVAVLANNHIMDFGLEGLLTTLQTCKDKGFYYVGAGKNVSEAFYPLDIGNLRIIAVAENEFGAADTNNPGIATVDRPIEIYHLIREGRKLDKFVVIVSHGGSEVIPIPPPYLRERYKLWIEYGADLIIGNHPHTVQGSEIHKDKHIFYSLGNFAFFNDNFKKYPNTDWSILVSFDIENNNYEVIPIILNNNQIIEVSDSSAHRIEFERLSMIITSSDYLKLYTKIASILYPIWYKRLDVAGIEDAAQLLHYLRCDAHRHLIQHELSSIIKEQVYSACFNYELACEQGSDVITIQSKVNFGRDDENWFTHEESFSSLLAQFKGKPNLLFLELGSWKGKSAVWIAQNILNGENSKIICVDIWDVSKWDKTSEETKILFNNPKRMKELDVNNIYQIFLNNIWHLRHKIIPEKNTTKDALLKFIDSRLKFDFIYIDADHSEDAVYNDFKLSFRCIKPGGFVFFDDFQWDSVRKAIDRISSDFNIIINQIDHNGAYYQFPDLPCKKISSATDADIRKNKELYKEIKAVFKSDWLSSTPIFYNELTGSVSENINDVIDYNNFEFHPEGFNNFLDFGYSVFEQTPIKYVKFLRHSARILQYDNGTLEIEYLEDPVIQSLGKNTHEDDILHLLWETINRWEKSVQGDIVIPTSGGYDSRLLNLLIEDKSRIRSFSYGLSDNQEESFEVVHARLLSESIGSDWTWIPLGNYHKFFDQWDQLFGISTHAHGMYQMEFYFKILERIKVVTPLLSGIIGDGWSGGVSIPAIDSDDKLTLLGYTHGMKADSQYSLLKSKNMLRERYYHSNKSLLENSSYRIVEAMRMKIILLSYLMKLPIYYGFKPWSPFLIPEIALGMLNLQSERRKDRLWQKEIFKKHGLNFEDMSLQADRNNTLNLQAIKNIPPQPLDVNILREVINTDYVDWTNNQLSEYIRKGIYPENIWQNDVLKAYFAYLTLRPIETCLLKRNEVSDIKNTLSRKLRRKKRDNIYYDKKYFNYQKNIGMFGGKANLFKFKEFILPTHTVIDFGSGGGYLLENIICRKKIGIEINKAARKAAQKRGIESVATVEEIDNASADVIISNHALEHVSYPLEILRSLRSKLKLGGLIVFVVPHQDTHEEYKTDDINKHLYTWNQLTLGNLFAAAGYKVIKVEAIQHQWPPNYIEIYTKYGEEQFHKICRENAIKNNNYQIRIVAEK